MNKNSGDKVLIKKEDNLKKIILLAEQGNSECQYELAEMYYYGDNVNMDRSLAVKWYTKAANLNNFTAKFKLGICYEKGIGVISNTQKAVILYEEVAKEGSAVAQLYLANCYYKGIGVDVDESKALYWYNQSANQGDVIAKKMLKNICNLYKTCSNKEKLFFCYKELANNGDDNAYLKLGNCYYEGIGVEQNKSEAKKMYLEAAKLGNIDAQFYLGEIYFWDEKR